MVKKHKSSSRCCEQQEPRCGRTHKEIRLVSHVIWSILRLMVRFLFSQVFKSSRVRFLFHSLSFLRCRNDGWYDQLQAMGEHLGVYMCVLCAEYAQFAKVVSIKSQRSEGQRISLKAKEKVMEIGCYEQVQHGAQLRPPSWNSLLAVWDTKEISKLQIY